MDLFFQPKYESASKCNASDVGETSGIGTSPTSSLVGVRHCNGCFKNGMRGQFQQKHEILRHSTEFSITSTLIIIKHLKIYACVRSTINSTKNITILWQFLCHHPHRS